MDMLLCLKKKEEFFGYDGSGDFELTESEEILSPLFRPQKALSTLIRLLPPNR